MSIVSTDLIAYLSVGRPADDTSASGGAIDQLMRPTFTQLAATDDIEAASSGTADGAKVLTITGRATNGTIFTDTISISAVANTYIATGSQFERIHEARFNAAITAGTITVRRAPNAGAIGTIPPNERGFSIMFKNSASSTAIVIRYELIYWLNAHATLALQNAKLRLSADPIARIRVGVALAQGDISSVANRVTAPAGITFVDDNIDQTIPGTNLNSASYIGQWIEQNLPANDPVHKSTFTSQISGTTV